MNNYMKPVTIVHSQYNKISDDLLILGANVILKFNVGLTKYSDQFGRIGYHREVKYNDKNQDEVYIIKRAFDFYISIENMKSTDVCEKEFIRIGITEIMYFRSVLDAAIMWFTSEKFKDLYALKDDKLIMIGRPLPIKMEHLPMNKTIIFEPTIYRDSNEKDQRCIRMYLSSDRNYVDMTIDRFMALKYLIDAIDMYSCAQNIVNYLGRPEFGTNLYEITNEGVSTDKQAPSGLGNKKGRTIQSKTAFDLS